MSRRVVVLLAASTLTAAPGLARQAEAGGADEPGGIPTAIGPSPPPNRFDPEHDARLAAAWGEFGGDPALGGQRPAIVPLEWVALAGGDRASRREVLERFVLPRASIGDERVVPLVLDGVSELPPFAIAEAVVSVPADDVRFVRASGVHTVFVNGDGFVGDPERRGDLGVPVALRAGENRIQLVGFDGGPLEVELWDPVSPLVVGSWAAEVHGADPPRFLYVPVFNATARPTEDLHFHYGSARVVEGGVPWLHEWRDGGVGAPLGMIEKWTWLWNDREIPDLSDPRTLVPISAFGADGLADRRLLSTKGILDPARPSGDPRAWIWPERRSADGARPPTAFVYEVTGDPERDREVLAAARYGQQLVRYRTGHFPALVPDAWFAEAHEAWLFDSGRVVVRFGVEASGEPGVLALVGVDGSEYAVRAGDAEAMRLVYLVDPFFAALGGPATFRVR